MKESVIIADDHPVTLNGIANYVTSIGYQVMHTYTNGIAALNNILALQPDYAILDASMPGMTGLEVIEKVRAQNKTIKLILYTMYNDTALFERAKTLEVNGYILKNFALEELETCLAQLRYNKQWFSPRLQNALVLRDDATIHEKLEALTASERKIIEMIAQGNSSKYIAEHLFISEKTVENHRSSIIKKLSLPAGKNVLAIWAAQYVNVV